MDALLWVQLLQSNYVVITEGDFCMITYNIAIHTYILLRNMRELQVRRFFVREWYKKVLLLSHTFYTNVCILIPATPNFYDAKP